MVCHIHCDKIPAPLDVSIKHVSKYPTHCLRKGSEKDWQDWQQKSVWPSAQVHLRSICTTNLPETTFRSTEAHFQIDKNKRKPKYGRRLYPSILILVFLAIAIHFWMFSIFNNRCLIGSNTLNTLLQRDYLGSVCEALFGRELYCKAPRHVLAHVLLVLRSTSRFAGMPKST